MRDESTFRQAARQAYERGRLRATLRVAIVVVPLTALCMWETRDAARSLALGLVLFVIATILRWRQRNGFWIVATGLRSGVLPLAVALGLCRFAPSCPPDLALALCGSTGLVSGGLIGRALTGSLTTPWHQWLGAATVAGLTASLGCMALGLGTAAGAAAGVVLGAALVANLPRAATA